MFRVEVKNLGPIIEGGVDVKPLTIFIGPNNSGKSYMAMLIYALRRGLGQGLYLPYLHWIAAGRYISPRPIFAEFKLSKAGREKLVRWLKEHSELVDKAEVSLSSLPQEAKDLLSKGIKDVLRVSEVPLTSEVKRCYRSGISEVVRRGKPMAPLSVSLRQEKPGLALSFSSANDKLELASPEFQLPEEPLDIKGLLISVRQTVRAGIPQGELSERIMALIAESTFTEVLKPFLPQVYYLPAARSGILQNHRALASFAMTRSPLIGIEKPLDIPQFTGVIADFIDFLLRIERRKETKLSAMADLLEKEVTLGRILIEEKKHLYPEIFYVDQREARFPLHRTSSGISELAPLILFLKYVVNSGDMLIIEEPEAHLHPAAQRRLALVLVKLVRAGAKLLITTHSDYLVEQLSNFISLSQLPERDRKKRGYGKEDYLTPEEVGAYLFKLDEATGCSTIEPLKVDKEGIDEEEFSKVAGELYDETVYLRRKLSA